MDPPTPIRTIYRPRRIRNRSYDRAWKKRSYGVDVVLDPKFYRPQVRPDPVANPQLEFDFAPEEETIDETWERLFPAANQP